MARLLEAVTRITSSIPEATAPSTMYWITGLSTTGSISLGTALDAGRKRVPSPAAGMTAFRTRLTNEQLLFRLTQAPLQAALSSSRQPTPVLQLANVQR